jgi:hypothetical protein
MGKQVKVAAGTVAKATGALAQVAATLAAPAAPAAPAPAKVVALRGGLAIASVRMGTKAYRVTAPHNVAWWAHVQATLQAGQGTASVQAVVATGVPATMVGYLVRRGYLQGA